MDQGVKFCKGNKETRIENNMNSEQCLAQIIKNEDIRKDSQQNEGNIQSIEDKKNIGLDVQFERKNLHQNYKFKQLIQYPRNNYYLFVFNKDSSLLFAGGYQIIKLFKFKSGKNYCRNSLIFMDKSNLLVSGSSDKSIIIWDQGQNSNWKRYQKLEGHQAAILIIINNKDEDLIISGSDDWTIKFWKKINMNWSFEQTIQTKFSVLSLSLNQSQSKLISCGRFGSQELLVIEQEQEEEQWNRTQTEQVNCECQQVCFITDSQFVFQGVQGFIEIYQLSGKQSIKEKQIEVQQAKWKYSCVSCPCKYVQSQGILIIKNGNYLNCFKIDENQNYVLQQQIEFSYYYFSGNISRDGQFLVTVDQNNILQIRKLQDLD